MNLGDAKINATELKDQCDNYINDCCQNCFSSLKTTGHDEREDNMSAVDNYIDESEVELDGSETAESLAKAIRAAQ